MLLFSFVSFQHHCCAVQGHMWQTAQRCGAGTNQVISVQKRTGFSCSSLLTPDTPSLSLRYSGCRNNWCHRQILERKRMMTRKLLFFSCLFEATSECFGFCSIQTFSSAESGVLPLNQNTDLRDIEPCPNHRNYPWNLQVMNNHVTRRSLRRPLTVKNYKEDDSSDIDSQCDGAPPACDRGTANCNPEVRPCFCCALVSLPPPGEVFRLVRDGFEVGAML